MAKKGWYFESNRHRLASKGIKTEHLHRQRGNMIGHKFLVTAMAFDRKTGEQIGKSRTETINVRTNEIFVNCRTNQDVKDNYEAFWNDLNPKSREVIEVTKVKKI